jgi:hypothetical protein
MSRSALNLSVGSANAERISGEPDPSRTISYGFAMKIGANAEHKQEERNFWPPCAGRASTTERAFVASAKIGSAKLVSGHIFGGGELLRGCALRFENNLTSERRCVQRNVLTGSPTSLPVRSSRLSASFGAGVEMR